MNVVRRQGLLIEHTRVEEAVLKNQRRGDHTRLPVAAELTHRVHRIGGHVEYEVGCRIAAGRGRAVQGLNLINKYELVIKGTQQIVVGDVVVRVAYGYSCELNTITIFIN